MKVLLLALLVCCLAVVEVTGNNQEDQRSTPERKRMIEEILKTYQPPVGEMIMKFPYGNNKTFYERYDGPKVGAYLQMRETRSRLDDVDSLLEKFLGSDFTKRSEIEKALGADGATGMLKLGFNDDFRGMAEVPCRN